MKSNPITGFFRSIAGKVTAVLALCILALVALNWLLNTFVLLDNYEREQRHLLTETYETINDTPRTLRALAAVLDKAEAEHGMGALLWADTDSTFVITKQWKGPPLMPGIPLAPLKCPAGTFEFSNRVPAGADNGKQWLTMEARTVDGYNVVLWLSLSDVRSGTDITNRFLLWTGLITLVFGTGAAVWLARSMTRPVRKLSQMASDMAHMNFSNRYEGRGTDELAELGQSLNTVSETMEKNLSELKTANLRLQSDMEAQTRQAESRTRFIRNVSHELKTPLALIQSYAEGLRENAAEDPESRAYYCEVIEDEAEKLTQLLAKLTTLMQLESGKEDLQIDRFDMTDLLSRLLTRYAPLFEEKHVPIPDLPHTPLAVWGDAVLIENVVINYITNALNHVTEGGEIRVTFTETDHNTARIEVFNTGAHIPEKDLPHLWESFYKVDKARTREYGGTGVGLSVVAAIMKVHAMPYGVENAENGVVFFFELSTK